MFKRSFLSIAFTLTTLILAQAAVAEDYVETEPKDFGFDKLAGDCIEVFAQTTKSDGVAYGDPIPVRLTWLLKPTSKCKEVQPDVKLLPPSAAPTPTAAAVPATGSTPAATPDVAKVLVPEPLDVPVINLQTIKSGKLSVSPSDVVVLSIGETGEQLLDSVCGEKCGKIVTQDLVLTQRITMQTVPPPTSSQYASPKPDDKTPPKYKKRAVIDMDFDYATYKQPGVNQPAWKTAHTPRLVVAIHLTAGISETNPAASESALKRGDQSKKVSPIPPATFAFAIAAIVLALPSVADLIQSFIWLFKRERLLSINEKVWLVIDDAIKEGEKAEADGGIFPDEQYRRIFYKLREHFGILGRSTTETLSVLMDRPGLNTAAVDHVFNRETLFFDKSQDVSLEERAELLRNIKVLIPRR